MTEKEIKAIFPTAEFDSDMYIFNSDVETKFSDEAQDDLFQIEDGSWWFKYRADVIYKIFKKCMDKDQTAIDIGGGNGFTTLYLKNKGLKTILLEPAFEACRNAQKRGLNNVVCGVLSENDVNNSSIPQAMMLDVLEHIENDREFLLLLREKLKKGGKVLITVPAFKCLWSSEDNSAGHFRRYNYFQLQKTVEDCGFTVEYENYFFEFGFLPILLFRVLLEKIGVVKKSQSRSKEEQKKIADKQFRERKGVIGTVLNVCEKIEMKRLLKGSKIKFGSSLICVVKKNKENRSEV